MLMVQVRSERTLEGGRELLGRLSGGGSLQEEGAPDRLEGRSIGQSRLGLEQGRQEVVMGTASQPGA